MECGCSYTCSCSCPAICLSIYPSIDLSIYPSTYVSIYLSVCLSVCLSASLKAKHFCETFSLFELVDVKNETILRDFFNFSSWQHQKPSNSARLPSRIESRVQSWRPFAIFPLHLSKVARLPRKSDARTYEVLHLSRKIILANLKIWCSKMQPFSGNQCQT